MTDKEFLDLVDSVCRDYKGDGSILASAVGSLAMGRLYGWRVVSMIHSEATVRKYQIILGVDYKDVLPERGVYAHRSFGLKVADKLNNFWGIVQGRKDHKLPRNEKMLIN